MTQDSPRWTDYRTLARRKAKTPWLSTNKNNLKPPRQDASSHPPILARSQAASSAFLQLDSNVHRGSNYQRQWNIRIYSSPTFLVLVNPTGVRSIKRGIRPSCWSGMPHGRAIEEGCWTEFENHVNNICGVESAVDNNSADNDGKREQHRQLSTVVEVP